MKHEPSCPLQRRDHSDAAKACSDAVNLHVSALGFDAMGKWVAVSLATGKSDGVLYDLKRDAIRHQLHEQVCAYVCIPPTGMNVCDAENYMALHRRLYKAGMGIIDPDAKNGGKSVIPRLTREHQMRQMSALR